MLERLAGNDALKAELGTALRGGRLPHAVLLVGEPGCGAGFAARCLAADYLYPVGLALSAKHIANLFRSKGRIFEHLTFY